MTHPSSRVWLEINLKAIEKNFCRIQKTVRPCKVLAALKANAYGLGTLPIAKKLVSLGVDRLGTAELKEAILLKKHFSVPIQMLSGILESEIGECVARGIVCPVGDLQSAQKISKEARRQKRTAKVHIKVDTGMGRLGIPYLEAAEQIQKIVKLPGLRAEGILSHLANANVAQHAKTHEQVTIFKNLIGTLANEDIHFDWVHIANSDGINNFPETFAPPFNLVRTGINLYGVFDLEGERKYELVPSLALKTTLLAKRHLPAGSTIGYGCTHTLFRDTWVGTIPAGYADGIPLAASNSAWVLIRGHRCPIIGRVSMDYVTIDLTEHPSAKIGDLVTIVGRSGKEELTIEDWARTKQTHPYEIICSLGPRVERIYLK